MLWFKKKTKEVNEEIPSLPELPKLDLSKLDLPKDNPEFRIPQSLPMMSQGQGKEKIEAVRGSERIPPVSLPPIPPMKMEFKQQNEARFRPSKIEVEEREEKPKIMEYDNYAREVTKKIEPVFVRIDRFQEGVSNLQEVKRKVQEIDALIKRTKEIRAKEEQELTEWEHEIEKIKGRLENIDRKIFSKVG